MREFYALNCKKTNRFAIGLTILVILLGMAMPTHAASKKDVTIEDVLSQNQRASVSCQTNAIQTVVSITAKNITFVDLFNLLKNKVNDELYLSYLADDIKPIGLISINEKNKSIESILKKVLSPAGLTYTIKGNIVAIKKIQQSQQKNTIKGKVVSASTFKPIIGATIIVEGTQIGATTNDKGMFEIPTNIKTGVLSVSCVGYINQKVDFKEGTPLQIKLNVDVRQIDDVTVVAYGTTTKREMTGAISTVKAKDFEGIPSSSVANLLQGRAAGVDISNISGAPGGGDIAITIRGYNSLDAEVGRRFSNPLWVVDGVPMNSFVSPVTGMNMLSDLNPDMIESVQVLKDASAAAIYGSRAANGVIIVTTKKGKNNQDATFSVNASQSWGILPRMQSISLGRAERDFRINMDKNYYVGYLDPETNRWKYPSSYKEAYDNMKNSIDGMQSTIDKNWIPNPDGSNIPVAGTPYQDSLNTFFNNSTNFFPIYYQTGKVTNANIQTYGGTEKMNYGIGFGYYNESGIMRETGYNRVDLNSSLNVNPVKRLFVDMSFNASFSNNKQSSGGNISAIPLDPYTLSSTLPGEGSSVWNNILQQLYGVKEKNRSLRLRTNIVVGYDIIDGLNLSSSVAFDYALNRQHQFRPSYLDEKGLSNSIGVQGINLMVLNETLLKYRKVIKDKHTIDFVGGFSYQYDQVEYNSGNAQNSPSDLIQYAPGDLPGLGEYENFGQKMTLDFQRYSSNMEEKVLLSYFTRLEYNYMKKYLFNVSFRRDGSSTFGENNRWGTFPSAAIGWTFTEENFIKDYTSSWFSFGKIRASWGLSGMHLDQNYLALGVLKAGAPYKGQPTLTPEWNSGLYNPNLSWEETSQIDLGIDMEFFDYRLSVVFDYYKRYTDNMLTLIQPLPGVNGYFNQWMNAAAISNEGVEFMVKYDIFRKKDLFWKVSVNFARNWNRFEKSYNGKDFGNKILGKPLNNIFALKTDGFVNSYTNLPLIFTPNGESYYLPTREPNKFMKPGDFYYVDVNGDGKAYDEVSCGSALPELAGGITSELKWKNIDVNLLISYQLGRHILYTTGIKSAYGGSFGPLLVNTNDITHWEKDGDNALFPKLQSVPLNENTDRFVEKVNWLKLKTIVVGYSLPQSIMTKMKLQQIRFFVSGENLLTFTNYSAKKSGMDPETVDIRSGIDQNNYPLSRRFTVGLTVKF